MVIVDRLNVVEAPRGKVGCQPAIAKVAHIQHVYLVGGKVFDGEAAIVVVA